jgi:hypothetical protein
VLTGALAFDWRRAVGLSGADNSHKAKVVARVKSALNTDFSEGRTSSINSVCTRVVPTYCIEATTADNKNSASARNVD